MIQVHPNEEVVIEMGEAAKAKDLYFVSINDFEAFVQVSDSLEASMTQIVETNPPDFVARERVSIGEDTVNLCMDTTTVMRVENWAGEKVDAWFGRFEGTDAYSCTFGPPVNHDAFELNVFWPNATTLHHCPNGGFANCNGSPSCQNGCTTCVCVPECQMWGFSTTNIAAPANETPSGNVLLWRNSNYLDPGFATETSFDNVLFGNDCGIAFCRKQNPGGTHCTDPCTRDLVCRCIDQASQPVRIHNRCHAPKTKELEPMPDSVWLRRLILMTLAMVPLLRAEIELTESVQPVYHAGSDEQAGSVTMRVQADDFGQASPESPHYVEIVFQREVKLADTLVDLNTADPVISNPIYLSLALSAADENATLAAPADTVSIVR